MLRQSFVRHSRDAQLAALRSLCQKATDAQAELCPDPSAMNMDTAVHHFDEFNISVLPNLNGKFRNVLRQAVAHSDTANMLRAASRDAHVVFGCSAQFVERCATSVPDQPLVIVHHNLPDVLRVVLELESVAKRCHFIKCSELMFPLARCVDPASLDRISVLSPRPFPQEKSSYKRLVNTPFVQTAHARLQEGRQLTVVSDSAGYGKWMDKEIARSKDSVAWTCKPERDAAEDSLLERELARTIRWRRDLVKVGATPSDVEQVIVDYDYARYYSESFRL